MRFARTAAMGLLSLYALNMLLPRGLSPKISHIYTLVTFLTLYIVVDNVYDEDPWYSCENKDDV